MKADVCWFVSGALLCAVDYATHHYLWAVVQAFVTGTLFVVCIVKAIER